MIRVDVDIHIDNPVEQVVVSIDGEPASGEKKCDTPVQWASSNACSAEKSPNTVSAVKAEGLDAFGDPMFSDMAQNACKTVEDAMIASALAKDIDQAVRDGIERMRATIGRQLRREMLTRAMRCEHRDTGSYAAGVYNTGDRLHVCSRCGAHKLESQSAWSPSARLLRGEP